MSVLLPGGRDPGAFQHSCPQLPPRKCSLPESLCFQFSVHIHFSWDTFQLEVTKKKKKSPDVCMLQQRNVRIAGEILKYNPSLDILMKNRKTCLRNPKTFYRMRHSEHLQQSRVAFTLQDSWDVTMLWQRGSAAPAQTQMYPH